MTLNYRVTGEGDPVVLVHGIGRSIDDWAEQHELLGRKHQVWSIDLPGFGDSDPLSAGHGLEGFARAVATFMREHNIAGAHIVGNSLGGGVAMQLAATEPALVRSLVLADPVGFGREVTTVLRVMAIPGLGGALLRPDPRSSARVERSLYADAAFATPARIDTAVRLAAHPHHRVVFLKVARSLGSLTGVRSTWRRRLFRRLAMHPHPTLVVWGAEDEVFPASHLLNVPKLLPHAETLLLLDTGHLPQIERAAEFAAAAESFWAGIPSPNTLPKEQS